jgi:hypothetical protein
VLSVHSYESCAQSDHREVTCPACIHSPAPTTTSGPWTSRYSPSLRWFGRTPADVWAAQGNRTVRPGASCCARPSGLAGWLPGSRDRLAAGRRQRDRARALVVGAGHVYGGGRARAYRRADRRIARPCLVAAPSIPGPESALRRFRYRRDNCPMGERDAAQADQLIRALCEVRDKTNRQLSWLGERDSQLEAAALRRDINEAQAHITRLQRRYPGNRRPGAGEALGELAEGAAIVAL